MRRYAWLSAIGVFLTVVVAGVAPSLGSVPLLPVTVATFFATVRAARRSVGAARRMWTLGSASLSLIIVANVGSIGVPMTADGGVATGVGPWVLVLSTGLVGVVAIVEFAQIAIARRPRGIRGDLLDLAIVVAGSQYALRALIFAEGRYSDLEGWRQAMTISANACSVVSGLLVAWVLFMPGDRPRSLRFMLCATGAGTVAGMAAASRVGEAATAVSGVAGLMAIVFTGFAALDVSAPEICRRAERTQEVSFGFARLVLFGMALALTPITVAVQATMSGEVEIDRAVWSSLTLALLVLLRVRSLFDGALSATRRVAAKEVYLQRLVENISDLIVVTSADFEVAYASPSAGALLRSCDETPDRGLHGGAAHLASLVAEDSLARARTMVEEAVLSPGTAVAGELELQVEGKMRNFQLTLTDLTGSSEVDGLVWVLRDVTEHKALEVELRHQALHDGLTQLPNRTLLADRLETAAARATRSGGSVGVIFIDLDDFKKINDGLGHHVGDELIVAASARLAAAVRSSDTVARLGGDEFAVVVEELGEPDATVAVAARIQTMLRPPFDLSCGSVSVTASIGVAVSVAAVDDIEPARLLRNADVAMYRAKSVGKNFVVTFEDGMNHGADIALALEMDLAAALHRGDQLEVHYQPVVSLHDENPIGAEALVRWNHPEHGFLPPMDFIPLAESTGMIVALGRFVLRSACAEAGGWPSAMHVSVNVSPLQLEDPDFGSDVRDALTASGLDPHRLILEVTESSLVRAPFGTILTLNELKALGVRIAIDDFGTGYSSLATLRDLPIDILKIDRSFVVAMGESDEGIALITSLIQMGRSLELETVAEGVEELDQAEFLRDQHCDAAQGYYYGRPVPPAPLEGTVPRARPSV